MLLLNVLYKVTVYQKSISKFISAFKSFFLPWKWRERVGIPEYISLSKLLNLSDPLLLHL